MGTLRKLHTSDVPKILDEVRCGVAQADIAARYGISQAHVSRIARRNDICIERGCTPEQKAAMIAAYRDEQLTQRRIGELFGFSQQHVGEILKGCGVEARCRSLTADEQTQIVLQYNSGLSITEIASRLGRNKASVARFLHRSKRSAGAWL